ncbi:MAG: DUF6671 family protein [Luteibaculaceae bacterium]
MFENRKLIIATKHKKELVIAPLLEKELRVKCFTDSTLDTDLWGTFTGEVERTLDPVATVRAKCLFAMEKTNCDLGVASEGSFGPHPTLFFANADDELLIFIDKKNDIEIIARELSIETNFNAAQLHSKKELMEFASAAGFPGHALILRKSKEDNTSVYKGITEPELLKKTFKALKAQNGSVYVETDMRAFHNPTRMKVIETATKKLVEKINSTCPSCNKPGFDVVNVTRGLPCGACGMPTNSIKSYIYTCKNCNFYEEKEFPQGKTEEDPMYCNFCNP